MLNYTSNHKKINMPLIDHVKVVTRFPHYENDFLPDSVIRPIIRTAFNSYSNAADLTEKKNTQIDDNAKLVKSTRRSRVLLRFSKNVQLNGINVADNIWKIVRFHYCFEN